MTRCNLSKWRRRSGINIALRAELVSGDQSGWLLLALLIAHAGCTKQEGVSPQDEPQKSNFYVERTAEVWS